MRRGAEKAVDKHAREDKGKEQRDKGVGLFVSDLNLKVQNMSRKCNKMGKKFARYVK